MGNFYLFFMFFYILNNDVIFILSPVIFKIIICLITLILCLRIYSKEINQNTEKVPCEMLLLLFINRN